MGVGRKTVMGRVGEHEAHDFGVTRAHADIAARTLKVVQTTLRAKTFAITWKHGKGRPPVAAHDIVLVRRLWIHALLVNDWLSVNRLALITARDHKHV